MADPSSGYEAISTDFLQGRGSSPLIGVGVNEVRAWTRQLAPGASVIDLGCGPGFPITQVLVAEGLTVFAVDAAPSFVMAFRRNLPGIPIACEAVQESTFFDRTFDGVLAWGLIFLLSAEDQCRLIQRIGEIMRPGGRLLFTSVPDPLVWKDSKTGLESRSLGSDEYRKQLAVAGITVASEYEDAGRNHYYDAFKLSKRAARS